jgi:hypothetical protein
MLPGAGGGEGDCLSVVCWNMATTEVTIFDWGYIYIYRIRNCKLD